MFLVESSNLNNIYENKDFDGSNQRPYVWTAYLMPWLRVLNQNICLFAHYFELQFQVTEELTELYPYAVVHNVPHQFQGGSFADNNFCMLLK